MNLHALLLTLEKHNIKIGLDGDRLLIRAPKNSLTPELRQILGQRKADLLQWLAGRDKGSGASDIRIGVAPRDKPLPLSSEQRRLWFIEKLEGGTSVNNVPTALRLTGSLDIPALTAGLREIVHRHEILRTTFLEEHEDVVQIVSEPDPIDLTIADLTGLDRSEREPRIDALISRHTRTIFDLSTGPLWCVHLLRTDPESWVLLINMHHIISDGWSMGILTRELTQLYRAFLEGSSSPLTPLSLQYGDFAHWQYHWLRSEGFDRAMSYWRRKLAALPPRLELPTDRDRPKDRVYKSGVVSFEVPLSVSEPLHELGRRERTTLFMTLLATYFVLLSRHSGQHHLAVGVPNISRPRPELEPLIGCFVNTLVMSANLDPEAGFRQILHHIREVCMGAHAHQDMPFEKLVEALQPTRDLSQSPFFQVMFSLQNAPRERLSLPGLELSPVSRPGGAAKFDLILYMSETPDGLNGNLVYDAELFDAATAETFARRYQTLLASIATDPDSPTSELPLEPEVTLPALPEPLERERERGIPISFHQERLWFIDRFEAGSLYPSHPVYHNIPLLIQLRGTIDPTLLSESLNTIVARHQALHTPVSMEGDRLFGVVDPAPMPFEVIDSRHADPATTYESAIAASRRPIDPTASPLAFAALFDGSETEALLLVTVHHLAADRPSMTILVTELMEIYRAGLEKRPPRLPELTHQYADFSQWQRDLDRSVIDPLLFYWRYRLRPRLQALELPCDRPRPAVHTFTEGRFDFLVDAALLTRARALAGDRNVSLFTLMLTVFKALLHRYAGQDEILVGINDTRRAHEAFRQVIGPFANLLTIRSDWGGNPSFETLLHQVDRLLAGADRHRHISFDQLVLELAPEKDMSRTALFDVLFQLDEHPVLTASAPGLEAEVCIENLGYGKYDLHLTMVTLDDGLRGALVYNTDFFDAETIERMVDHFCRLLEGVLSDPVRPVDAIPLLSREEITKETRTWNDTACGYPDDAVVHRLFASTVRRFPNRTAISWPGGTLTYSELSRAANRLAHHLIGLGVEADSLVALCLDRSPDLIIAMLAVLQTGAGYLPLDPGNPRERRDSILADAGIGLLISSGDHHTEFPGGTLVLLDRHAEQIADCDDDPPARDVSPDQLAYCIYTSGSTGRPKGVLVTHRNLVRLMINDRLPFVFSERDVWTMFHNANFDFSVWEIYGALLYGGRLVIVPTEATLDPALFLDLVDREGVTVLNQTPSSFQGFAREALLRAVSLPDLRYVIFGGEALAPGQLDAWDRAHRSTRLINMYGITETTVHVTFEEIADAEIEAGLSNIGLPIPTTTTFVLDPRLRPLPVGVTGEICVGGMGLSRGYLGRPGLTASRFVPDPFGEGARLYRSGDLGKRLATGEMVHLGRMDHQIQLRGFRIELGEIRARLLAHETVAEAVLITLAEKAQIVAYIVAEGNRQSPAELRRYLEERLPHYMVPAHFVVLDRLPLTANGKVDLAALPDPGSHHREERVAEAPRTPREAALAEIWSEVLGLARVGVHDEFFEIGGHSLLATQVVSRIQKRFGVSLPIRTLFEATTIETLAERIAEHDSSAPAVPPMTPVDRGGELPLSFAQQRLWFLDQLGGESTAYNMPLALRLEGSVDAAALSRSIAVIVDRHEVLRTTFTKGENGAVQVISDPREAALPVIDISGLAGNDGDQLAEALAVAHATTRFSLALGPLWRVGLVRLASDDHLLLINMHHIISDGWSMGLFVRELGALYPALILDRPTQLEPLPIQYADFAAWQRRWLQGEVLDQQLAFWRDQLRDIPPLSGFPPDRPRPSVRTVRGAAYQLLLPRSLRDRLNALSREEEATLFMTLLAAFGCLLFRYSGATEAAIGTPIANRNRAETENLIGFFINTLVLPIRVARGISFREMLVRVRETCFGAYNHQDLPFEKLVDELVTTRSLSRHPLFQIMFALQNATDENLELPGLTLSTLGRGDVEAKFDLSVSVRELPDALLVSFGYNADLYEPETIQRIAAHYGSLLQTVVEDPDTLVEGISLLNEEERHQILETFNDTDRPIPGDRCIHDLFSSRAAARPDSVAVISDAQEIRYGRLDTESDRLAHVLRSHGLEPDQVVAIATTRSIETIVGMLAILKAGGAYLPIDPDVPRARIRFMVEDSDAKLVLTQRAAAERLPELDVPVLTLDDPGQEVPSLPAHAVDAENLAYVMYTSGSTGTPKGVSIPHRGVIRLLFDSGFTDFGPERVFLQAAPLTFDASIVEIWGALLHGGTCVLHGERVLTTTGLRRLVSEQGVDVVGLTPLLFNALVEEDVTCFEGLSWMYVGGDVVSPTHLRRVGEQVPGCRIRHCYGPTESTLFTTTHPVTEDAADETALLPIGRPIGNTRVYLLNLEMNPVPIGALGELYIAGLGLARGYLGRPALTAERFLPNPHGNRLGDRLYRSGDLAYYLPDGKIVFAGRMDHQVKIRGFRIEPGEIEACICRFPGVSRARVLALGDSEKRLVAFVTCSDAVDFDTAALRGHLEEALPDYMIPESFHALADFPLTANGKLDKTALIALESKRDTVTPPAEPPRNEREQKIAGVWRAVLGLEHVDIDSNFFEIGGSSLHIVTVFGKLQRDSAPDLQVIDLFRYPTIRRLAEYLGEKAETTVDREPPQSRPETVDPAARRSARRQRRARRLESRADRAEGSGDHPHGSEQGDKR